MDKKIRIRQELFPNTYTFAYKRAIIEEVENGLISVNQASVRYNLHRSTIERWLKKYGNFSKKIAFMGKATPKQEIRELKTRLKQLEAEKRLWQDIVEMLGKEYGPELKKKYFPGSLQKDES
jgi:transposase-like protein